MWRRLLIFVGGAIIVIAAILAIDISDFESRHQLANPHPNRERSETRNQESTATKIGQVIEWLDIHRELVNVVSTVLIAIFTGTLWWATRKLGRFAEIQATDVRSLLRVASSNATAAMNQADAMERLRLTAEAQQRTLQEQATATHAIAEATGQSADIARRALTELERPYIVVRVPVADIKINEVGNYSFFGHPRWEVSNYGRTPAILVDRITRWKVEVDGNLPHAIDPRIAKGLPFPEGCLASREAPYSENHNYFIDLDGYQDIYGARAGHRRQIWVFGYLRYKDILGGVYVNGFALVYDSIGDRFVHIGPPSHNYTYVEKQPGT